MPRVRLLMRLAFVSTWVIWTSGTLAQETHQSGKCTIVPLHTGVCQIGKDYVLGAQYSSERRLPLVIYAFLVKGWEVRRTKSMCNAGVDSRRTFPFGLYRAYLLSFVTKAPDQGVTPLGGLPFFDLRRVVAT